MATYPNSIKLCFIPTGEMRRIPLRLCPCYDKLVHGPLTSFFGKHPDLALQYKDDEGDVITIASDEELKEAVQVIQNMGLKSLKINVFPTKASALAFKNDKPEPRDSTPAIHVGVRCDRSGQCPIIGPRFKLKGKDYDLCENEYNKLPSEEQSQYVKITKPRMGRCSWRKYVGPRHPHCSQNTSEVADLHLDELFQQFLADNLHHTAGGSHIAANIIGALNALNSPPATTHSEVKSGETPASVTGGMMSPPCGASAATNSPSSLAHILGAIVQGIASQENASTPVHYGVTCDRSGMSPIIGTRFHLEGADYDLCGAEFAKLPELERLMYVKIERPGDAPVPFTVDPEATTPATSQEEPECAMRAETSKEEAVSSSEAEEREETCAIASGTRNDEAVLSSVAEEREGTSNVSDEKEACPESALAPVEASCEKFKDQLTVLAQMGLMDRDMNIALLERYQGRLPRVINSLLDI